MPSLPAVTVSRDWTHVQSGPFVGMVFNLTGNQTVVTVAATLPAQGTQGTTLMGAVPIQLQAGETLYARAYNGASILQLSSEFVQPVTFPLEMMTDEGGQYARLRTDNAQTGFFAGREFRLVRKITSPRVYRFTFPVPVILFEQLLTASVGDIELFAWAANNVTPDGTWTPVQFWPKNGVNLDYAPQAIVEEGGTITVTNTELYRDYARVATSGATAQRFTVGGPPNSERYLAAGVYYVELSGAGEGSYSLMWEERP